VAKKFKFSLSSLMLVRHHRLMMAKREAMFAEDQLSDLKRQIDNAKNSRNLALDELPASINSGGSVKVLSYLVESETARITMLDQKVVPKEAEVERHRRWVAELAKELKALEKLEEKQRKAHEEEMKVQERRIGDRWASERFALEMSQKENLVQENAS
jgi:flagellar export protein FliJ